MVYNQILRFFFFFLLFFELIYSPIVNSAVSWYGNSDYFTDSGTLHRHHHRLLTDANLLSATTKSRLLVACSAGVFWAGESCLFIFVLLKPLSLIYDGRRLGEYK